MKILQVTAVDFTVEKFLLPLIHRLQKEGHEVHIACRITNAPKHSNMHAISFERSMRMATHAKALKELVKLMKSEKFDVVHTHTPVASMLARIAAKIARVPTIIYTAHGFYFHERMNKIPYKIAYTLEKYAAKWGSDYVFFQSEEDYQLAVNNHFKRPERLIHIQNGVNRKLFEPNDYNRNEMRQKLGIAEDIFVYLFVGRLVYEKGLAELTEAFQLLNEPKAHLVIVGGQVEGDRDTFPDTAQKNVTYLGLRQDIAALLHAADAFVLPSHREGLPRSIIEAMAMEKPVIATDIRGCREEVIHQKTGLLCTVQSASDLKDAMNELFEHQQMAKAFGKAGRQRFLEQYDEEKVLDRQMVIFQQCEQQEMGVEYE